jgi:3-isopropylmalate/(R)-2-methylmalate dehydratase large subunit|tara:strand:+ start:30356 stop:31765 length:1410 start_codon:yes stop_codon:yes gene_type:complete
MEINKPKTLFEKVWTEHEVNHETSSSPAILYIDLHLIHEVTTPQAFSLLKNLNLSVRMPNLTIGTMDHSTPTVPVRSFKDIEIAGKSAANQVRTMMKNCEEFGIELFGFESKNRGIVHVIGPELGLTQPGKTIVCGDSHTSTHGAFGALAFGIGTTEVGHVLATQCLLQRKPKTLLIEVNGHLNKGVTAKDLILAIIGQIGVSGGTGYIMEFKGDAISNMDMEARLTICNMSIEAGAKSGMIAPDDTTYNYLYGRPRSPKGSDWDRALLRWKSLPSDSEATYDKKVSIDASKLTPMVTFGTNPGMVIGVNDSVPQKKNDKSFNKSLEYMQVLPGKLISDNEVDVVFIGSCTNSRINDLQQAAQILKGRKISKKVKMLVVPGSQKIKKEAEDLGLDKIFISAGAQWRESGCSMCLGMNGDTVSSGKLSVSTSNRNFEGRQGKGARTILASPLTAAASAIEGRVADPRKYL